MDCPKCAKPVAQTLKAIDGVQNVRVNGAERSASVDVPDTFDRNVIRTKLLDAGFFVQFAGEKEPQLLPVPDDVLKTLDIAEVDGKDLEHLGVPGKITIVDVYADWCGPCKTVGLRLQHFARGRRDIAVRRINLGEWNTPMAKHLSSTFHINAIPYLRVYNARGKFVGANEGMWDELLDAVEKASR
jgi:thiol-disulfide isomerase/thioredoxin